VKEDTEAHDRLGITGELRKLGLEGLADMPQVVRKNFTMGAVVTIAGVLVSASFTCAYFFADAKAARLHEAQLQQDHDADHTVLVGIDKNLAVMKENTNVRLMALEKEADEQKSWRERARGAWEVPTKQVQPAKVVTAPAKATHKR